MQRPVVENEKDPPQPRASLRLWLAVLLTVVALWFVDALLKPNLRRQNPDRR
jgi:hypothetical protein